MESEISTTAHTQLWYHICLYLFCYNLEKHKSTTGARFMSLTVDPNTYQVKLEK